MGKHATLAVMAAGIGSRFGGGIKQLEPVGPNGEIIMDYSVYDAVNAGFDKVVFIIRKDLEKDFKEIIGNRISEKVHVEYAYQELSDIPEGFTVPEGRKKPWGTGQAILTMKGIVNEPFAVINADDYYGKEGFEKLYRYLTSEGHDRNDGKYDLCMAGFILSNTLSENGGVSRGICEADKDGYLTRVTETYEIRDNGGALLDAKDIAGNDIRVRADMIVSMNMWGLVPEFFNELETGFTEFLKENGESLKSEYLLPNIIDKSIKGGRAAVKVLSSRDRWFGVTYKEDKEAVVASIRALVDAGVYPEKLF